MIDSEPPMRDAIRKLEIIQQQTEVISCSLGVGYQWIDSPVVGASAIVVTNDDPESAHLNANQLSEWIWEKRSQWNTYSTGDSVKEKVEITDDMKAKTLTVMKQHAKLLTQFAIDEGEGDPYNATLLTDIENTASITQINIIYENFLGAGLPKKDATDLNLYENDGHSRKYTTTRNKPSFL